MNEIEKEPSISDEFSDDFEPDLNSQSRRWVMTINNPVETDEEFYAFLENLEHFKYAMFQRERGVETGTEHFQVFLVFTCGKRFSTVKNIFPRAHIEKAKGSNIQCRDYCSKSETRVSGPFEVGTFVKEGERTDIKDFMELVHSGASDREIERLFPKLYLSNIDKIELLRIKDLEEMEQDHFRDICVTYIYGESRTGKSWSVRSKYKSNELYVITDYHRDPWYNYKGQKVVLFEEYRSNFSLTEILNYLDGYELNLARRYHNIPACYDKVFITSNIRLTQQYKNLSEDDESKRAFYNRIHNILYFTKDCIEVEKCRDPTLNEIKSLISEDVHNRLKLGLGAYVCKNIEEIKSNEKLPFIEKHEQQIFDEIF